MLEFDFEIDVERSLPKITDDTISAEIGSFKVGDQKHRIIVCRHWLLGLCHNGIMCSYLHRLDKNRMPACRHGKQCKIKNCPLKHVADEELEECIFFRQGFCYNGPKCSRRHLKRTPEECVVEYPFEQVTFAQATTGKKLKAGQRNENFKVTLCYNWLLNDLCPFGGECHYAHGEDDLNEASQGNLDFLHDQDVYDPTRNVIGVPLVLPIAMQSRCSYFILQSPDLRALAISKRRGVWSVPTRIASEMNAAFRSFDYVIIYFSVRPLRGIYGVAKLTGMIPPSGPNALMSPEFSVSWMRTLRISLSTVAQLKLGTSGMFVGRSSTDGRFDNKVGFEMLLTAYRKPIWDWSLELEKAESSIRLQDPSAFGGPPGPVGEYYPPGGISAYYLPPDTLFPPDWMDRAGMAVNDKGVLLMNRQPMMSNHQQPTGPPAEFYRGTHPGFIICATTSVVEEMFARMLFGLPLQFKEMTMPTNVPIFIFDSQANVMLGIFYANSAVTLNIDATAFLQVGVNPMGGTLLPVQLMFRHALECPPIHIPLQDPELQQALGELMQNLGGPVSVPETKALANLFAKRAYAAFPMLLGGSSGGGGGAGGNNRQHGGGAGGGGGGRPGGAPQMGPSGVGSSAFGGYYKPPFRCVEVVTVDIPGNPYELKKRVLGPGASNVMNIVDSVGSKSTIRVRLRGIGSGFIEGPNQAELPEALHFNVSTENEQLLALTVVRLRELIARIRSDMGY